MREVTEPYPALYKVTGPNGESVCGGSGTWPLPTRTRPGEWWTIDGPLVACSNGLHLATAEQLPAWYWPGHHRVWRAEVDGELWDAGEKYVARRVRLLPSVMPKGSIPAARAAIAAQKAADRLLQRADRLARKLPASWRAYTAAGGSIPAGIDATLDAYTAARAEYDAAQKAADRLLMDVRRARVPVAPR